MTKLRLILSLLLVALLLGCIEQIAKPTPNSLEVQAIQSKNFNADRKLTFNAVMSTLQDLGYIINSASLDTGFITAESPIQRYGNQFRVMGIVVTEVKPDEKTLVTASFDEIGPKNTRVRLNFVTKVVGQVPKDVYKPNDSQILDPAVYNNAFNKIGDAIFIRQGQDSSTKTKN